MSEGSGVLFRCSSNDCDYETIFFPGEPVQREKWLCGHELPEVDCPECGNDHTNLGDLFETGSRGLVPAEDQGVVS